MKWFEERKNRKRLEKVMIDFAEGRITCKDFWDFYLENEQLQNLILTDKTRIKHYSAWFSVKKADGSFERVFKPKDAIGEYALENFPNIINIDKLLDRVEIYEMVYRYFLRRKIKLAYDNPDSKIWKRIADLIPDWLFLVDGDYFVDIFFELPETIGDDERDELFKNRLYELFRYDDKPPEWIQNAQWPIVNGVPLVFRRQVDIIEESEDSYDRAISRYYFYDSKTNEETVIEQFDFA